MARIDEKDVYDCVIIGAGISGLMAANEIRAKGYKVVVVDKGRGVGGRMATRRVDGAKFDHGAQFFTVKDERFRNYVDKWEAADLVSPWFYGRDDKRPFYRVNGGMTALAKELANGIDVRLQFKVERLSRESGIWEIGGKESVRGRTLLISAPVPQSLELLKASEIVIDPSELKDLESIQYRKAIALMLVLDGESGLENPGFLKIQDGGDIDVISDNFQKGISPKHAVTIHSSHDFADRFFEEAQERVVERLLEKALPHLHSTVAEVSYHRWRFAKRVGESNRMAAAFPEQKLWLCGDSFGAAKVEGAGLSGIEAAKMVLANIG